MELDVLSAPLLRPSYLVDMKVSFVILFLLLHLLYRAKKKAFLRIEPHYHDSVALDAIVKAADYIQSAIRDGLTVGQGKGCLNHFHHVVPRSIEKYVHDNCFYLVPAASYSV